MGRLASSFRLLYVNIDYITFSLNISIRTSRTGDLKQEDRDLAEQGACKTATDAQIKAFSVGHRKSSLFETRVSEPW
ncbi:hypothetical protein GJ744_005758 [Endocarpon pusillum]|uniref:Uncharacterized protein n=1 Tax=Endocarpon pusillum TaxID=364733 RepID=A0A8H7E7C5_9EURO|nr:hypothetical protein GJ744_005758 [Endocarpon pusillum]